ncbi:MAG TPA: response regulator [Flavitalea sp.]|nr:response regulator [Flavitalea sp.]
MKKYPTCFLMDDDIDDQEVFELALQKIDENIQFSSAKDGAEGLQKLKENEAFVPDFIFLDINMPKMNGMQCLPEIKKLQHLRNSRIIMYSTSSSESIQRTSQKLGADGFLVKPTKIGLLVNHLTQILEKNKI